MTDALAQLGRHLNRVLAEQLDPLYLVVDDQLRLLKHRGQGGHYGLPVLQKGMSLAHELAILSTADPADPTPQSWPFVALPGLPVCHVHALRLAQGWGVALLNASEEHAAQQARQQTAHEIILLRNERERLIEELAHANRLKSEFIARMSHEFRTPLASVIGYTDQLLELRVDDDEVQYHLAAVARGARYLLNLVENLLDQARIEAEQLTPDPGPCDLRGLTDEVDQMLRQVAEQRRLTLQWHLDDDIPARLWIDAVRLKQVLTNLVGNAIKFTVQGGVRVELAWAAGCLEAAVVDTGPGIDDADAAVIFEPFRQGRDGGRAKGAGLGLPISQALVQAMGGSITLSRAEGGGSRFAFSIEAATVPENPAGDTLLGRRIVVVDDDADLRELLERFLGAAGCEVRTAHNAVTAHAVVRAFGPDVVLLDLNLGGDDGRAVASALRAQGYRNRIVLLSATRPGDRADDDDLAGGADARWTKPIGRQQLLDGLADLVNDRDIAGGIVVDH